MKTLEDLSRELNSLSDKIIKEVTQAQIETAKVIEIEAKENAPKMTGRYAQSIKTYPTKIKNKKIETIIGSDATVVSSKGNKYNLGFLLEHGTSPHLIYPVNAKVLHFQINGEDIFTKLVHHPGFVARPHYYTAINNNKELYMRNIKEAIRRAFNE